jgi:hypothetical protein
LSSSLTLSMLLFTGRDPGLNKLLICNVAYKHA